jgi:diaminopimelate epimerase
MQIEFSKYQGTGNDFILIDNRHGQCDNLSQSDIQFYCDRRFGIGADGLILIQLCSDAAFEMVYFNADGSQSFCGNGARCAVHFAGSLGIDTRSVQFKAIDGFHHAAQCGDEVKIHMQDVHEIVKDGQDFVLNTGSPHYVNFNSDHSTETVVDFGKSIRYSEKYRSEGINVNLLSVENDVIRVATYERGVEDETLSCGTGVTACALVYALESQTMNHRVKVRTKGGNLEVFWERTQHGFDQIYLVGPATFVFQGKIERC